MQVPERLALIGGSILLASTLVFTLKSQASRILPKINNSASKIYDHIGDAKKASDFDGNFQDAQKKGWTTGTWGNVKFYVDDQDNLYVGGGESQGQLKNAVGSDLALHIKSITFDKPVQAPSYSMGLLSDFTDITEINGIDNIDVSQANDLTWAFSDDKSLPNLDISSWQTPNLQYGGFMFGGMDSLKDLDISNLDTSNANMENIFNGNKPNLNQLEMGDRSYLKNAVGIQGTWMNGGQKTNAFDLGMAETNHAGDWHKIADQ